MYRHLGTSAASDGHFDEALETSSSQRQSTPNRDHQLAVITPCTTMAEPVRTD